MDIKERIAKLLERQFGVDRKEFLSLGLEFEERGKKRIYAFKNCGIEVSTYHYGLYFGTIEKEGIRLSIEGSFIVGRLAKKNVIEVDDETAKKWMSGEDLVLPVRGYVILKWRKFFLGCGKGNGKIVKNYVPKERRINPRDL